MAKYKVIKTMRLGEQRLPDGSMKDVYVKAGEIVSGEIVTKFIGITTEGIEYKNLFIPLSNLEKVNDLAIPKKSESTVFIIVIIAIVLFWKPIIKIFK